MIASVGETGGGSIAVIVAPSVSCMCVFFCRFPIEPQKLTRFFFVAIPITIPPSHNHCNNSLSIGSNTHQATSISLISKQ